MRLSRMWRIMQIEEDVIHWGQCRSKGNISGGARSAGGASRSGGLGENFEI